MDCEGCENLHELDLHYNQITEIENYAFINFTNLTILDLSQNLFPVYSIKISLSDLCYLWNTSVKELDISGNRIEFIETNALILTPQSLEIIKI
ncbi:uncharacterized protein LOC127864455 [Dreissena polymorpha]|uniref:uncharacterized protein LOC127864455 n=1 Tax=Dreissena polymorpha TaxID=45954 RepID=UPI00226506AF|nr:uncharacterized protein LOC127864455 [Dreissena polymorpha]